MYKSISINRIGIKISKNYILQKCEFCRVEKEVRSYNDNKYFCDKTCYNKFHNGNPGKNPQKRSSS